MFKVDYNPDVLSCLANLSNDEVFTPPSLANQMLDLLPDELWSDKNIKFLDPVSKSGVFLREITKRLIEGLKDEIPDKQERINHILKNQVFGIAITELTSLLSRRSLYCSKFANGEYSICDEFKDGAGNIYFDQIDHSWENKKCIYCGVSKELYDRDEALETHAYQFIHPLKSEQEVLKMKFDVIIGNPPYQMNVGIVKENYAIAIYQKFVQTAIKLNPRFISMIIPSRWFTGGRSLGEFREQMLNDRRLKVIVDHVDSRDCFPGVDVSGGIMYFLWDAHYNADCKYENVNNDKRTILNRKLNEFQIFPRYNEAVSIIKKVLGKDEALMSERVSPQTPFGLYTNFKGKKIGSSNDIEIISSSGKQYVDKASITKNYDWIKKYKVIFSKATSEHGGQVGKSGKRRVLSSIKVLKPNSACTQTYLLAGSFDNEIEARNLEKYLYTRFLRFLLLLGTTSQDLSKEKFCFVPVQDFSKEWSDDLLFEKYSLNDEEIKFIDSMIRPMEINNE